jgi:hypothetical protein
MIYYWIVYCGMEFEVELFWDGENEEIGKISLL